MWCRKDTENIDPKVSNTGNGKKRYYQIVQYAEAQEDQEVKGLLNDLGVRTPLSKVTILDDILF